jgi:hypothetical protein
MLKSQDKTTNNWTLLDDVGRPPLQPWLRAGGKSKEWALPAPTWFIDGPAQNTVCARAPQRTFMVYMLTRLLLPAGPPASDRQGSLPPTYQPKHIHTPQILIACHGRLFRRRATRSRMSCFSPPTCSEGTPPPGYEIAHLRNALLA